MDRIFNGATVRIGLLLLALSGVVATCSAQEVSITCGKPTLLAPPPAATAGSTAAPAAPPSKSAGQLLVDPNPLDLKVFESAGQTTFSVLNQTSDNIQMLHFSSLGLLDGKTYQKINGFYADPPLSPALDMNARTDCTFILPPSNHAGAFAGTLRVVGNGFQKDVPLTIRIRGPYLSKWKEWPLVIMTVVFLLGWGTSLLLDRWFTLLSPRVQQLIPLREAQSSLKEFLGKVAAWEKTHSISLTIIGTVTAFDKSELDTLLKNVDAKSLTDLQQAAQRFTLADSLNDEFYTALQIAAGKIPPASLAQVTQLLDNVPRGTDPVAYRAALLHVLTTPVPPPAPAPPNAIAPFVVGISLATASAETLHREMELMDYLKLAVTGVVVWITAYTVYYLPNPSFGTSLDYLTLFLWSLGLTTTGSQLVNSVRRP